MAGSPRFKVYRGSEYIASCKYPEDAAAILAMTGTGTIRDGHSRILWTEGVDGDAGESYDAVAEAVFARL